MGDISFSLMRIIISRQIKKEVDKLVLLYKSKADSLDKNDSLFTEKILSLSVKLSNECNKISLEILSRYDKVVKADPKLRKYYDILNKKIE